MEIIVTRDCTALTRIRTATMTGNPTWMKLLVSSEAGAMRRPTIRPTTRKIKTGNTMVPNAPIGSRRNTLISIQVNFQSPRIIESLIASRLISNRLISNRMTGNFQKDILEIREDGAEIGAPNAVLGQAMDHLGH